MEANLDLSNLSSSITFKILERIVYNGLYQDLNSNNILYKKQFGFQTGNSTEHAILQLVDQISNSFEKKPFSH